MKTHHLILILNVFILDQIPEYLRGVYELAFQKLIHLLL